MSLCEVAGASAAPATLDFSLIVFQGLAGPLDPAGSAARSFRFGATGGTSVNNRPARLVRS
jgi:hypothetical protein